MNVWLYMLYHVVRPSYDLGMIRRFVWHLIRFMFIAGVMIVMIGPEWPAFGDQPYRLRTIVGLRQFDFVMWEARAFEAKLVAILAGNEAFLAEAMQRQVVEQYLELLSQVLLLEDAVSRVYADPAVTDASVLAAGLLRMLADKRAEVTAVQPLAEAIVQNQVSWALQQEGFTLFGEAWPPVLMHMTPLPWLLVLSPRDHIESVYQVSLQEGLTLPVHEALETAVVDTLNLSALVVPLGGLGTYPAMIMETTDLPWMLEVVSHEWSHHWLTLHPIGMRYAQDAQMRIINETVASMIDVELRNVALARFYPDLLPALTPTATATPAATPLSAANPPAFDFRAEMAQTRIRVDELLAAGKIAEAEAYMEDRRAVFWQQGYRIRKLNQAYFAFYGAYAAQPGATGGDPIGPMLQDIRAATPSLRAFMDAVAPITSLADLERIYGEVR